MRKEQTSHKNEHNTLMCFPLEPVFIRDGEGVPNFNQSDKKEYISERIKESIDIFGSHPERFGTILMSAGTCPPTTRKGNADQAEDTAQACHVIRSSRLSEAI